MRFLGNRSSGKQGVALAAAARDRGAHVTLIAAHLEVPAPAGVALVEVQTAQELATAVAAAAEAADAVVMAAAVADYRPETVADGKIKKDATGDVLELRLVKNPDILASLTSGTLTPNRSPGQIVIGFAAETETDDAALLAIASAKAIRKGADFLVVNRVGWTEVFASDDTRVTLLDRAGSIVGDAVGDKMSVAHRILDLLV